MLELVWNAGYCRRAPKPMSWHSGAASIGSVNAHRSYRKDATTRTKLAPIGIYYDVLETTQPETYSDKTDVPAREQCFVDFGVISELDIEIIDIENSLETMKVLVDDVCVGENEPTVVDDTRKLTKEELNRGCPLGVSRITNSLYVCGAHALPGAVQALRPGLVVNAAPELPPPPEDYVPRHYVPLLDTPNSDMFPFMERVADLINEVVTNGELVLVHCVAGVSRSVTLCLAYLVKYQKMTLSEAYHHMKLRRPQIRPNTGFFKQLIKYEERLFGEASVKMVYCEVIDKEIPDVYEPDYRGMAWFRQRYGPIEKS